MDGTTVEVCAALEVPTGPASASRELVARVERAIEGARDRAPDGWRWWRALRAVLIALAGFSDGDGVCWPSQETVATEAKYGVRHVRRALDAAESMGLLLRAVPRVGARALGATTRYALPWWGATVARGLEGARRVMELRKRGPLPARPSAGLVRSVLDALEAVDPVEVARRTLRRLPGDIGREAARELARVLFEEGQEQAAAAAPRVAPSSAPRGALGGVRQRTQGPEKTSRKIGPDGSATVPGSEGSDRGPSARETSPMRPGRLATLGLEALRALPLREQKSRST